MLNRSNRRQFILSASGLLIPMGLGLILPPAHGQIRTAKRKMGPVLIYSTLGSNTPGSTTAASSYATGASFTPTANALCLCGVVNSKASAPDTPTVSGNGLTWVQIATVTFNSIASPTVRATLFRALGASPSNGATTADFGGVNQTGGHIFVCQFKNTDTSGTNGSGAIVQSTTNRGDASANPNITLSALAQSRNAVFAWFGNSLNGFAGTAETGWTEDYDGGYNTPATGGYATHHIGLNDASIAVTASSSSWGGVGAEIKSL